MFKKCRSILSISCMLLLVVVQSTFINAQDDEAPIVQVGSFRRIKLFDTPSEDADELVSILNLQVPIVGVSPDDAWYLVDYEGQLGWIRRCATQCSTKGDLSGIPVLEVGSVTELPTLNVLQVSLYLMSDSTSEVVEQINDTSLPILALSDDEEFYLVTYNGGMGWVLVDLPSNTVEGNLDNLSVVSLPDPIEPCIVSTDQARTVSVRVGFGTNRGVSTFLATDTDFEVLGQNTDGDDAIWYALDKEEAAPSKSINGDVVWVVATEVDSSGDCDQVDVVSATFVKPLPPQSLSDEPASQSELLAQITVPGNPIWIDSGIRVTVGQTYNITASGFVNVWNMCETNKSGRSAYVDCADMTMGPDGGFSIITAIPYVDDRYNLYPMPNEMLGALIARIGNGSPFVVGSNYTFTAQVEGTLWFLVNDADWVLDNSGSFTVTITLQ
jgi:hypothetical protein